MDGVCSVLLALLSDPLQSGCRHCHEASSQRQFLVLLAALRRSFFQKELAESKTSRVLLPCSGLAVEEEDRTRLLASMMQARCRCSACDFDNRPCGGPTEAAESQNAPSLQGTTGILASKMGLQVGADSSVLPAAR